MNAMLVADYSTLQSYTSSMHNRVSMTERTITVRRQRSRKAYGNLGSLTQHTAGLLDRPLETCRPASRSIVTPSGLL